MRRAKAVLVAVMTIPLAGCLLNGKPKTVAAAPAPPRPAAPTPPPEPLSIPQTNVELPPPQPVKPEALVTEPQVESAQPAHEKPSPAPAKPRPPAAAPKPAEPQAPEAEPEPARAPIQEILPADVLKQLRDSAHKYQADTRTLLAGVKPRTNNQRRAAAEIEQFLKQSEEAENAGDMRLADQLAERAHILAKELQSGK
jgi:hypothetical protein